MQWADQSDVYKMGPRLCGDSHFDRPTKAGASWRYDKPFSSLFVRPAKRPPSAPSSASHRQSLLSYPPRPSPPPALAPPYNAGAPRGDLRPTGHSHSPRSSSHVRQFYLINDDDAGHGRQTGLRQQTCRRMAVDDHLWIRAELIGTMQGLVGPPSGGARDRASYKEGRQQQVKSERYCVIQPADRRAMVHTIAMSSITSFFLLAAAIARKNFNKARVIRQLLALSAQYKVKFTGTTTATRHARNNQHSWEFCQRTRLPWHRLNATAHHMSESISLACQ